MSSGTVYGWIRGESAGKRSLLDCERLYDLEDPDGRDRVDRLGVTAAPDAPDMAPTTSPTPAGTPVTRTRIRGRKEPHPLDQLPAWRDLVPVMESVVSRPAPSGVDALLDGLNPEQLRAVTHGDGPLLVVAGAGTGKTQVITRRIAWLIATRRARSRRRSSRSRSRTRPPTEMQAPRRPARPVRLHGHARSRRSTRSATGSSASTRSSSACRRDVRVLSRPEVVIFLREHLFDFELDEYRPLGDPTRFLGALATLFSRCKDEDVSPDAYLAHADRRRGEAAAAAEAAGAGRDRADARRPTRSPRRRARQRELARAYARYQELLAANGCIDFGDQVALALRLVRESPAARAEIQAAVPVHPRRRVPGHEPRPVGARRAARRAARQRDGRRRRRPVDLQVPRRGDQQHPRVPRALPAARTSSCAGTTARCAPILDALVPARSASTTRTGSRSGPAIVKRLVARARATATRRTGPPRGVRDGRPRRPTGSPPRSAGAIAAGARAARRRRPRPRERATPTRSCAALNVAGIPWRFSGTRGPVRPARGPAAARVPARDRRPRLVGRRLRARGVRAVRPRRRGPDRDREQRPPAQPHRLCEVLEELERQPGILRLDAGDPGGRRAARRATCGGTPSSPTSGPPARSCTRSCANRAGSAGSPRADSVAAEEALPNIARFFDIVRAPVRAARRRPGRRSSRGTSRR